jgi:hypothetical protein
LYLKDDAGGRRTRHVPRRGPSGIFSRVSLGDPFQRADADTAVAAVTAVAVKRADFIFGIW